MDALELTRNVVTKRAREDRMIFAHSPHDNFVMVLLPLPLGENASNLRKAIENISGVTRCDVLTTRTGAVVKIYTSKEWKALSRRLSNIVRQALFGRQRFTPTYVDDFEFDGYLRAFGLNLNAL